MSKEPMIFINKETVLKSLLCDFITVSFLLFAFWFNFKFIEGNNFVDIMILIGIILASLAHVKENRYNCVSDEKIKKIEKILKEKDDV